MGVGADSVCSSNIKDHADTDQHAHAMLLLNKEYDVSAGLGPSSLATVLSDESKAKLEIAHFEKLGYTKYSRICELEATNMYLE